MPNSPGKICIVCHRQFANDIQECPFDRVRLSERDSRIGTIFDEKYEILDFIGMGGMSRVYKARHTELNRIIALKILKSSELIDLQRFRREAVSVAQLEQENIAKVYSFSVTAQGVPYMAQEYLEGQDLAEILAKEKVLTPERAVSVFCQVAAALEHAHARNVIHRDIKPGNILLLDSGDISSNVKVVDFGMSKLNLEDDSEHQKITQQGEILGTRKYISPEQYLGQEADARADIYALGVSLFEAVAVEGKVPEPLSSLIARATEEDLTKRIQTATEMREALVRMRDASTKSGMHFALPPEPKPGKDLFGTFYLWTMLIGMTVVGVCAAIIVKQRMAALEVVTESNQKASLNTPLRPLSLEATNNQATKLASAGRLDDGIALLQVWLNRNNTPQKWQNVCIAYKSIADLNYRKMNFERARADMEKALGLCKANGDTKSEMYIGFVCSLAAIQNSLGETKEARKTVTEALSLTNYDSTAKIELRGLRVIALNTLAMIQNKDGDYKDAIKTAKESVEISSERKELASFLGNLALTELATAELNDGEPEQALKHINKALTNYHHYDKTFDPSYIYTRLVRAQTELALNQDEQFNADYNYIKERLREMNHSDISTEQLILQGMRNFATATHREKDLKEFASE